MMLGQSGTVREGVSLMRRLLCFFLLGLAACGSSHEADAAGDVSTGRSEALPRSIAETDDLKSVEAALNAGHPWRATQLVAPILRVPQTRTHAALLLAARAAAGWNGWPEVEKLLAKETWLDAEYNGEGRELLVRSALE